MADPAVRVKLIFGRFESLVEDELNRWELAADEASQRRYTADKFASDVVGCWSSVADAWTFPLTLWKKGERIVGFVLKTTDTDALQVVAVPNKGAFDVVAKDLTISDLSSVIPAANVDARISSDGDFLVVGLSGLAGLKAGIYTGSIVAKSDGTPVASVVVRVEQP